MVASLNGHVEVVDKLVQHGATADLQTRVCVMPLIQKIDKIFCNTKASIEL